VTWRIGLATGVCPERPILGSLDAIEATIGASGPRGIEFSTPRHHFEPWEPEQVEQVARRLAGSSLVPVSMHAPFGGRLDLSDDDDHRLQDTLNTTMASARALARLGGTILVAHPTDIVRHGQDVQARLERAARSLKTLTQACRDLGLTLAIESPLPHLIGGHPDEFAWLLHQVGPDARVCLDTGHTHLAGHWRRFIEIAGERVVHVHAHDNRSQFDDHLPPGEGHVNWGEIKATLEQINYGGWIILELKCPEEPLTRYFARACDQADRVLNGSRHDRASDPSVLGFTLAPGGCS
jgi:sugar phosphate isomerase/epimerase